MFWKEDTAEIRRYIIGNIFTQRKPQSLSALKKSITTVWTINTTYMGIMSALNRGVLYDVIALMRNKGKELSVLERRTVLSFDEIYISNRICTDIREQQKLLHLKHFRLNGKRSGRKLEAANLLPVWSKYDEGHTFWDYLGII